MDASQKGNLPELRSLLLERFAHAAATVGFLL